MPSADEDEEDNGDGILTPHQPLTKIAAGAIQRDGCWLVQERKIPARTGGTIGFFGGAEEGQDRTMRIAMQRESKEELVLINRHDRPSRQPIQYGAQIATVTLHNFEIHLFVAQIDGMADVRPSSSEADKTVAIHWMSLAELLSTTDKRLMLSTRLLAACIANVPPHVLGDCMRPVDASMLQSVSPGAWSLQPRMSHHQRISTTVDRQTIATYLAGYIYKPGSGPGTSISTYGDAEDELVAWLDHCVQGGIKWCDIWEMLSFGAFQIKAKHGGCF
jgi:8-oxo-dGTP pyrophosphatase MutT (NUDIX family)